MLTLALALTLLQGPKLDTPENTVRSFLQSVNRGAFKNASDCVVAGKYTYPAEQLEFIMRGVKFEMFTIGSIGTAKVEGTEASVPVKVGFAQEPPTNETVYLVRDQAKWRISPNYDLAGQGKEKSPSPVGVMSIAFAQPTAMLAVMFPVIAQAAGPQPEAVRPMGSLAAFTLIFGATHGDTLPNNGPELKKGLEVYTTGGFGTPRTVGEVDRLLAQMGTERWSFNASVMGKSQRSIRQPFQTVLIYEGENGRLDYRHEGNAIVALACGIARMVTPDQAKQLRWVP